MSTPTRLAERYRTLSARIARRAARVARRAATTQAAAEAVAAHQMASAALAQQAVTAMLAQQGIEQATETLNLPGFVTLVTSIETSLTATGDDAWRMERVAESLVQDSARAAQGVAVAAARRTGWVRHLTLPSCSRCAVLAGRVYRYSEGFQRHPNCDCVMIPTTVGNTGLAYDLPQLARDGKIRGLSRADMQALDDGADLGQVVNVRRTAAGLAQSGRVLARAGRPTPEGIYRMSSSRDEAIDLLRRFRYLA